MDPVRKSDRIGLPFTRDLSGTGPERIQTDSFFFFFWGGGGGGLLSEFYGTFPAGRCYDTSSLRAGLALFGVSGTSSGAVETSGEAVRPLAFAAPPLLRATPKESWFSLGDTPVFRLLSPYPV